MEYIHKLKKNIPFKFAITTIYNNIYFQQTKNIMRLHNHKYKYRFTFRKEYNENCNCK